METDKNRTVADQRRFLRSALLLLVLIVAAGCEAGECDSGGPIHPDPAAAAPR